MKKFLTLVLLTIIAINTNAKLTKVDCKWSKIIEFDAISLSEQDFEKGHAGYTSGKLLINYEHFGSAGSLCTVSIDAGEKFKDSSLNGTRVTKLEDVIVLYDPDEGALVILDKFKEPLLYVVGGKLKLLLFCNITPFLAN